MPIMIVHTIYKSSVTREKCLLPPPPSPIPNIECEYSMPNHEVAKSAWQTNMENWTFGSQGYIRLTL